MHLRAIHEHTTDVLDLVTQEKNALIGYPDPRRDHMRAMLAVLDSKHGDLIARRVGEQYSNPHIIARIRKFVSVVVNPSADIAQAVACLYKQPVRREVLRSRGGVDDNRTTALRRLYEETRWPSLAPSVHRAAWYAGPVLEVPIMRGEKLRREIARPDCYSVILDPDDPLFEPPVAAAWRSHWRGEVAIMTASAEAMRVYDRKGAEITAWDHGCRDADGEPCFPGTIWRLDHPVSLDRWWSLDRNQRLQDGSIECGAIFSGMQWVRKAQNRKVPTFFGNLDSIDSQAQMDPEIPITGNVSQQDIPPQFSVADLITSPEYFLLHLEFIARTLCESKGVPQSVVSYDFATSGGGNGAGSQVPAAVMELQHERLSQVRNALIPPTHDQEIASAARAVSVARAAGHPLAPGLPEAAEIADGRLAVIFGELNRIEDPNVQMGRDDWDLTKGLTTHAKILQRREPHLSDAEAQDRVIANIAQTTAIFAEQAARGSSVEGGLDAGGNVVDPDTRNGRKGPQVRDATDDDDRSNE